jgi:hypothetical protein
MLVRVASEQLGVPESELVAKDSVVTHISTGRRRTYGELAHAAANSAIPDSVMLKEPKLRANNPRPSRGQIVAHMAGNLCRCGTYSRIVRAMHRAAEELADTNASGPRLPRQPP